MQTGFKNLDHLIGGFQPGELVTLSARPRMEATDFVLSIMANIGEQNKLNNTDLKVLYFPLEQSGKQLLEKFQKIAGEDVKVPFQGWTLDIGSYGEEFYTEASLSLAKVISALARKVKPDLIVIDHLERLTSRNNGSREDEMAQWLRDFKEIAAKYGVPILIVTELGEKCEGKGRLVPKHFRYATAHIDKLGFLYHDTDSKGEFRDTVIVYFYGKDSARVVGSAAMLKSDPECGRVVEED